MTLLLDSRGKLRIKAVNVILEDLEYNEVIITLLLNKKNISQRLIVLLSSHCNMDRENVFNDVLT